MRRGGRFVHWLAWGIPPDTGGLAEGEAAPLEGRNDFGTVGYRGPCPPRGRGRHRYRFRLHALGEELRLAPGAGVGELERALTGNVLGVAELVGIYERWPRSSPVSRPPPLTEPTWGGPPTSGGRRWATVPPAGYF